MGFKQSDPINGKKFLALIGFICIKTMKRNFLFVFIILSSQIISAQDLVNELNGFSLNQFREVAAFELKKPLQKAAHDDGYEYEVFLLKADSSAYMVFEYPNWNTQEIWSIQLFGTDSALIPGFKGLKMGMSKEAVIEKTGRPSKIERLGQYGELLEYKKANYSLEINPQNQLASIKIRSIHPEYFPEPDLEKIPSFVMVQEILMSGDKQRISEILSPGLEIYYKNKTRYFKHAWRKEIEQDLSGIYALIDKLATGLDKVNRENPDEYEENMRVAQGQNPLHVIKIKKHAQVKEIVMRWEFGRYLIWEIRT